MKTFKDLDFKKRKPVWDGEITNQQAVMFFENGYGCSVLLGDSFYSNGIDTYELAVIKGNEYRWDLTYETPITRDVLGYLSEDEVTKAMIEVQQLEPMKQ